MKRKELARMIVQVVLEKLSDKGEFVTIEKMDKKPIGAKFGRLSVLYSTPFLQLPGNKYEYILDIWEMSKGKVMSARWKDDINNIEITSFKNGLWINEFLPGFTLSRDPGIASSVERHFRLTMVKDAAKNPND